MKARLVIAAIDPNPVFRTKLKEISWRDPLPFFVMCVRLLAFAAARVQRRMLGKAGLRSLPEKEVRSREAPDLSH